MAVVNRPSRLLSVVSWFERVQVRIARLYDRLATPHRKEQIEHLFVYLAALGFLLHLTLIFLAQRIPSFASLAALIGTNYLSAIYTPFALILFYEVLLLVLSVPESTTRAIGAQFEIISLITLRNVFKDMAEFESLTQIARQLDRAVVLLLDMVTALLLFLLVAVFYHINSRRTEQEQAMGTPSDELQRFITRKKMIALVLCVLFFVLLALSIGTWLSESYAFVFAAGAPARTVTTIFIPDLFTVIIFTDVLLLVLSLLLSDRYQLVFRNAGFVITTILLRVSLSAARPYNLAIAVIATLFGILVLRIYKYCSQIGSMDEVQRFSES